MLNRKHTSFPWIREDLPVKDGMNAEKYGKFFLGAITFLRSLVAISVYVKKLITLSSDIV